MFIKLQLDVEPSYTIMLNPKYIVCLEEHTFTRNGKEVKTTYVDTVARSFVVKEKVADILKMIKEI